LKREGYTLKKEPQKLEKGKEMAHNNNFIGGVFHYFANQATWTPILQYNSFS